MPGSDIHSTMQQMAAQHEKGKGGDDAHEGMMEQQAEQQRQAMDHQFKMEEMNRKYGLEEKKAAFDENLKEREFQRDSAMQNRKLLVDSHIRQKSNEATIQDQSVARKQQMDHELRLKGGKTPEEAEEEVRQMAEALLQLSHHLAQGQQMQLQQGHEHHKILHQLLGKSHEHTQHLSAAIQGLSKAHTAKRRTKAVRDSTSNKIIGSESYVVPE